MGWFLKPIHKRNSIKQLTRLRSEVISSLRRAKKVLEPRFRGYALKKDFLDLRILMEKWILCNPCGIWVIDLWDHKEPRWTQTRSRVWSWSTKEGFDLISDENKIKEQIFFWNLNAMIQVRTLTQNHPRERNNPRARACDISRFHHRIVLKFGGPLEKTLA